MDGVRTARDRGLVILRVVLGFGFLYAGLEKVLEFKGTGPFSAAGFLAHATAGTIPNMVGHDPATMVHNPTHQLWVDLAANTGLIGIINFLVVFGEIAIGLGLVFGVLTGFAAFFGATMNMAFLLAGSASTNPVLFTAGIGLILAWRVAGFYGIDRWLLPMIGVPWKIQLRVPVPQPAGETLRT